MPESLGVLCDSVGACQGTAKRGRTTVYFMEAGASYACSSNSVKQNILANEVGPIDGENRFHYS